MPNSEQIRKASEKLMHDLPHLSADELEYWVRFHNEAYFEKNEPLISDEVFDKLVETLRMVKADSRVLEELGENPQAAHLGTALTHREPMLSLDKCYDDATFLKWRKKISGAIVGMPKIDGVACAVHFDTEGKLIRGLTRGDGKSGEDITRNVKLIKDIKNNIDSELVRSAIAEGSDTFEIRGEVYMKISRFKAHYENEFANPRNLAAGALKQKEAHKSAEYGLSFFPYDVRGTIFQSEKEKFDFLTRAGFSVPPLHFIEQNEDFKSVVKDFTEERDKIDFEIDGVVFRANLVSEQNRLGETAHHPRFAIAYKFQGESAQTHLVDVQWSVARTGVITPVAVVQPVFVSGATVTRASLHNLGLFLSHDLAPNALVEIVRRGGVIPHVERVLRSEGELLKAPEQCPSCSQPVKVDGDFLRCSNPSDCRQIQVARILHYCWVLDIEGFGEKWVTTLFDKGIIRRSSDLYRIEKEQLLHLDRMGDKLAQKLVDQINNRRELNLAEFICALGFDEIGPTVAEVLVENFASLQDLRAASSDDLTAIHGIGESIASALLDGFSLFEDEIEDLLTQVRIVKQESSAPLDETHPLFAKSVVFTGKMAHLERKKAQEGVKKVGGKTPSSVSASTDLVVIGDEGSALLSGGAKSTKHKTAEKLIGGGANIKIVSESEFLKLLSGS